MKENNKKDRKRLFMILSIIVLGVFTLSVVYAALSTTLNVTGTAEVQSASWGVKVEAMDVEEYFGAGISEAEHYKDNFVWSGSADIVDFGKIEGTTISNISVTVTTPGDFVAGLYKVTNTGTIPMVLDSYELFDIVISSNSNNQSDVEWGYSNVISVVEVVSTEEEALEIGDVICPGEMFYIALEIRIDDVDTIPSDSLNISSWGSDVVFVQGNDNLCS